MVSGSENKKHRRLIESEDEEAEALLYQWLTSFFRFPNGV